jgi:hypothetical protein
MRHITRSRVASKISRAFRPRQSSLEIDSTSSEILAGPMPRAGDRCEDANSVTAIDRPSFLKSSRNPARESGITGIPLWTLQALSPPAPRPPRSWQGPFLRGIREQIQKRVLYGGDCSHRRKCRTSILSVIQLVEKQTLVNRPNGSDRPRPPLRSMCSTSKNGQGLFYTRHRARRPLDLLSNKFWNNGYAPYGAWQSSYT